MKDTKKITDKNTKKGTIKIAGLELTLGNSKLPITTAILNMGTAHNCPSDKCGLCPFGINGKGRLKNKCYALKSEYMYVNTKLMRERQEKYWLETPTKTIVDHFNYAFQTGKKGKEINAVRFNESGDFHSKECLTKLKKIAKAFPNIEFYTYTHRSDIMKSVTVNSLPTNLNINLSYVNNKKGFNTFCLDTQFKPETKTLTCTKCFKGCTLCHKAKGLNIAVKIH